jgi:tRNA-dihydrouridine synthase A
VEEHLKHVDGVMLGREAYHNPYVLAGVDSRFYGADSPVLSREAAEASLIDYARQEVARGAFLGGITRHALGLYRGVAGARGWRRVLSDSRRLATGDMTVFDEARTHLREAAELIE